MTQPSQAEPTPGEPAPAEPAPGKFGRWKDRAANRITPDAAKRQGAVTALAMKLLGSREKAIAFLNADSAELAGRPLDLAVASDGDCERVLAEISRLAGNRGPA